jgi:hypothetical protein
MTKIILALSTAMTLWTYQAQASVNGVDKICGMYPPGTVQRGHRAAASDARRGTAIYSFVPDDFTLADCRNMAALEGLERGAWRPVCRKGGAFIMPVALPSLELSKPIPPRPEPVLWDTRPGRGRPSAEDVAACADAWRW